MQYIEEEITLAKFSERFLATNDFTTPSIYDTEDLGIEVLSKNFNTGKEEYKKIKSFIVKPEVAEHYSDGILCGTKNHMIIEKYANHENIPPPEEETGFVDITENDKRYSLAGYRGIYLNNHPDFKKISKPMKVVDLEVEGNHNYYANGRLNQNTTSGGKALAFHSTIRMRLAVKGKIKKGDDIVGIKIEAKIIKNRIGPPFRKATFDMYFDSGIDHYSDWLEALQTRKIVTKSGQTYSFDWVDITTGEVIKKDSPEFTSKEFPALMESNQEVKDYLYQRLCDVSIMKYKDPTMSRLDDDTEVEDGTIEE